MNEPYIITLLAIVIYLLIRTRHRLNLYILIFGLYVTIGYKYVMKYLSQTDAGPIIKFLILFGPILLIIGCIFLLREKERARKIKGTPYNISVLIEPSRTNIIFWAAIVVFNLTWVLFKK